MFLYIFVKVLPHIPLTIIYMRQAPSSGGREPTPFVFTLAFRAPGVPLPQVEVADPMG